MFKHTNSSQSAERWELGAKSSLRQLPATSADKSGGRRHCSDGRFIPRAEQLALGPSLSATPTSIPAALLGPQCCNQGCSRSRSATMASALPLSVEVKC